jgi:putative ABC transport system permease protein
MSLVEGFLSAWEGLSANKLRAALTMLGVMIGVAAVVALLAVGEGVDNAVTEQIRRTGTNLVVVQPDPEQDGQLTNGDLEAIRDPFNAPAVAQVTANAAGQAQVVYAGGDLRTTVSGVTPEYLQVREYEISLGDFITPDDLERRARVAVLGWDAYEALFDADGDEYPVGQTIKLNGMPFQVVGVLTAKGGVGISNEDSTIFVPLTTAQGRLYPQKRAGGEPLVSAILVQAVDEDRISQATEQIADLLRARHRLELEDEDDFIVFGQDEILDVFNSITDLLTIFLGAIAGISLLVGGIGIMNIMLVSVTERTREIGIRKAVGALRRDILTQFLIEALVLSLMGGLIGLGLGVALSTGIGRLSPDLTPLISPWVVLVAVGFAAAVGLFFGLYPALRASKLRPIEALRYE